MLSSQLSASLSSHSRRSPPCPKALLFVSQRGRARATRLTGLQSYGKGRFMRCLKSLVCDLPGTLHSPSLHNPPTVTPYNIHCPNPSIGHLRNTRPAGYQKQFRLTLTAHRLAVRPNCELASIRRCWHSESKQLTSSFDRAEHLPSAKLMVPDQIGRASCRERVF